MPLVSASVPINSPLVYNARQLPYPPTSPDVEREGLSKYIEEMKQYHHLTTMGVQEQKQNVIEHQRKTQQ